MSYSESNISPDSHITATSTQILSFIAVI